jgi:hypothetical protein
MDREQTGPQSNEFEEYVFFKDPLIGVEFGSTEAGLRTGGLLNPASCCSHVHGTNINVCHCYRFLLYAF